MANQVFVFIGEFERGIRSPSNVLDSVFLHQFLCHICFVVWTRDRSRLHDLDDGILCSPHRPLPGEMTGESGVQIVGLADVVLAFSTLENVEF